MFRILFISIFKIESSVGYSYRTLGFYVPITFMVFIVFKDKYKLNINYKYLKIFLEAKINGASYENLFELIKQLYMQYKYTNDINKEKVVLELKGILLNISQMQQLSNISSLSTEINVESINILLACA